MRDGRILATDAWTVALPPTMVGGPVPRPPPECRSMAIVRGEVAPDAPAVVILTARSRSGVTVRAFARTFTASFTEPPGEGRSVRVAGARSAIRLDGLIEIEEGLSEDSIERIALVLAATAHEFVTLTVRTRPDDRVSEAVQELVASFTVRAP